VAQEVVESLDGYKDYMKEQRGDSLNFGDYWYDQHPTSNSQHLFH
jgi:hypothetical protein